MNYITQVMHAIIGHLFTEKRNIYAYTARVLFEAGDRRN